ncbi:MAG TPA: acetyl-CoA carboxylase biotin carboxylase subunit [Saprospiraceae bacterium]|nr:acetyl-CoA carboxylase biotin carboxylase subunit [Saprospiraceae bacterium]
MIRPIKKILIANRGEIAARIIRTCQRLNIKTVAVYSEADSKSPHVSMADESVFIGPSPSRESYLNAEKIIKAALETHADAIHPGYGFLSENDVFARAVENAGILFIGPSPESIHTMGNKIAAKEAAKQFRIPLVPGSESALSDLQEARDVAKKVGYPLLVKAAAGGGGKGMRIVHAEAELESQVERAMSEALSSFGDGSVFIEKYVSSPRHIEIQVLADQYGHCIHLFERECSIQRRHQKIIEEAPSSILTSEKREIMGQDAIRIAQSCQYRGAGTVEFLVDDKGNHYFLEMNTRLQVEHPVTEFITGLDLVEWQIRIAEGNPLTIQQNDLSIDGHALELRVYAENALEDFRPSTGKLIRYRHSEGEGIRVDDGYAEGLDIPIHYDPMISKLIVHAASRKEAIQKMTKAIDEYIIHGVDTTLSFGKFAINHPDFISGNFDTNFVAQHMEEFISLQKEMNHSLARFVYWLDKKRKSRLVLPEMDERLT